MRFRSILTVIRSRAQPGLIAVAGARVLRQAAQRGERVVPPLRPDHEAHDALLCIAEGAYIAQGDRRRLTPDHAFKSASEMRALFADLPEAVDNTLVVAERCAWFPEFVSPILPPFATEGGRSEKEELFAQSEAGLEDRLVKRTIREAARPGKVRRNVPQHPDHEPLLRPIGRAIKASETELSVNPRARSAVMRVAEKLG